MDARSEKMSPDYREKVVGANVVSPSPGLAAWVPYLPENPPTTPYGNEPTIREGVRSAIAWAATESRLAVLRGQDPMRSAESPSLAFNEFRARIAIGTMLRHLSEESLEEYLTKDRRGIFVPIGGGTPLPHLAPLRGILRRGGVLADRAEDAVAALAPNRLGEFRALRAEISRPPDPILVNESLLGARGLGSRGWHGGGGPKMLAESTLAMLEGTDGEMGLEMLLGRIVVPDPLAGGGEVTPKHLESVAFWLGGASSAESPVAFLREVLARTEKRAWGLGTASLRLANFVALHPPRSEREMEEWLAFLDDRHYGRRVAFQIADGMSCGWPHFSYEIGSRLLRVNGLRPSEDQHDITIAMRLSDGPLRSELVKQREGAVPGR